MKPTFDPIKIPKTPAAVEKAARTSTRSKARFFEEETPETNGKRSDENLRQPELEVAIGNSELKLEEESEEELLRQLGLLELEQGGGNSTEQTSEELDLEIELLEQAGGNSTEPTPEDASLMQELKQAEEKSTEPTPEELDLELEQIEQTLKKQYEEELRQRSLEKAKKKLIQNKGGFNPLITPYRNPTDLLGGMAAKGGAAAEEELGKEEPEIENRNRPSFFTRIGNMTSISSFCRSLLPNRGAAAENESDEGESHKQAWNKEQAESESEKQKKRSDEERVKRQLKLKQLRETSAATREIRRNLSKDLKEIEKTRAEANKKSEEKIRALKEKQVQGRRKSRPSNTLTGARATTTSKSLANPRQNPKR